MRLPSPTRAWAWPPSLRFILEDGGFEVHTAENGKKVLEMLTTAPVGTYDVILMDVRMPQMDGYEATRAIRELPDEGLSSIPIVAASANAFSEDVDKALAAGMDAYIAKPLDVDVAFSTLAGVLDSPAKKWSPEALGPRATGKDARVKRALPS